MLSTRRLFAALIGISLFVVSLRNVTDPDFGVAFADRRVRFNRPSQSPVLISFHSLRGGHPWITHEWLSDVLMFILYRLGGFGALSIFFAVLNTATFALVYRRCSGCHLLQGL